MGAITKNNRCRRRFIYRFRHHDKLLADKDIFVYLGKAWNEIKRAKSHRASARAPARMAVVANQFGKVSAYKNNCLFANYVRTLDDLGIRLRPEICPEVPCGVPDYVADAWEAYLIEKYNVSATYEHGKCSTLGQLGMYKVDFPTMNQMLIDNNGVYKWSAEDEAMAEGLPLEYILAEREVGMLQQCKQAFELEDGTQEPSPNLDKQISDALAVRDQVIKEHLGPLTFAQHMQRKYAVLNEVLVDAKECQIDLNAMNEAIGPNGNTSAKTEYRRFSMQVQKDRVYAEDVADAYKRIARALEEEKEESLPDSNQIILAKALLDALGPERTWLNPVVCLWFGGDVENTAPCMLKGGDRLILARLRYWRDKQYHPRGRRRERPDIKDMLFVLRNHPETKEKLLAFLKHTCATEEAQRNEVRERERAEERATKIAMADNQWPEMLVHNEDDYQALDDVTLRFFKVAGILSSIDRTATIMRERALTGPFTKEQKIPYCRFMDAFKKHMYPCGSDLQKLAYGIFDRPKVPEAYNRSVIPEKLAVGMLSSNGELALEAKLQNPPMHANSDDRIRLNSSLEDAFSSVRRAKLVAQKELRALAKDFPGWSMLVHPCVQMLDTFWFELRL